MRAPAPTLRSVALLERAVGYTRDALAAVDDDLLDVATPCARWTLRDLLWHMDDALAAFTEAAEVGVVALEPLPVDASAGALVDQLRSRACDLLTAWARDVDPGPVQVGVADLDAGVLAAVGALEITVHGWDVGRCSGIDHPIPPDLAGALLEVAQDVVGEPDRPGRFAPAHDSDSLDPGDRLLAFLGR